MKNCKNSTEFCLPLPLLLLVLINIICHQTRREVALDKTINKTTDLTRMSPVFHSCPLLQDRIWEHSCTQLSWLSPLRSGTVQQAFLIFHELGITEALARYSVECVATWVGHVSSHDQAKVRRFWKNTSTGIAFSVHHVGGYVMSVLLPVTLT